MVITQYALLLPEGTLVHHRVEIGLRCLMVFHIIVITLSLRALLMGRCLIEMVSQVIEHLLQVELWLLLDLCDKNVPCMSHLLLPLLKVLAILSIE